MYIKPNAFHWSNDTKSLGHPICHAKDEVECTGEELIGGQLAD